jgi:hypothetical protein
MGKMIFPLAHPAACDPANPVILKLVMGVLFCVSVGLIK